MEQKSAIDNAFDGDESFTAEARFAPLVEETMRRQLEEGQIEVGWGI